MDMHAAYREVGTYRAAAEICGTTPKTVKRAILAAQAAATSRKNSSAPVVSIGAKPISSMRIRSAFAGDGSGLGGSGGLDRTLLGLRRGSADLGCGPVGADLSVGGMHVHVFPH